MTVTSCKPENVETARAELAKGGGRVRGVCADVRDFDDVGKAFEQAAEQHGPVDVLVSGAAGNFLCEAKDVPSNGFRVVIDIDLIGTFHVLRHAYAHLRKPGASVSNITAPQSFIPMRFQAHAGAAKAGVDQLMRNLVLEWGGNDIRINSISPISRFSSARRKPATFQALSSDAMATAHWKASNRPLRPPDARQQRTNAVPAAISSP